MNEDIQPARPAFLPDLAEGEILYSWTAHYHRLSGNVNPSYTSKQIFGDHYSGLKQEFPSQLAHFVSVTDKAFGSAEKLAYEHSLFGFYSPFQSEVVEKKLLHGMIDGASKFTRQPMRLSGQGFSSTFALKACPDCMNEDTRKRSITRWYLEHQYPAAWVCRKHSTLLRVVKKNVFCHGHQKLLLPQDITGWQFERIPNITSEQLKVLSKLVDFGAHIANRRIERLNLELLRQTYIIGAKKLNWFNRDGSLNACELWFALQDYYRGLDELHDFENVRDTRFGVQAVIRLFTKLDLNTHPTRHILLMAYLFDSPTEFHETYRQVGSTLKQDGMRNLYQLLDVQQPKSLHKNKEEIALAKSLSIALDVNNTGAMHMVKCQGINWCKKLIAESDRWDKFRQLVMEGGDLREAIMLVGRDVSYLRRYLSANPNLEIFTE